MEILKAIILGIVQGITEWLPISSTGHMILFDQFLHLAGSKKFVDTFLVVIQFGSILAVLILYFNKLNPFSKSKSPRQKKATWDLWFKVLIAVLPSGIIGILFEKKIDEIFFKPVVVAMALVVYGIIMIWLESRDKEPKIKKFSDLSYKTAFMIGMFQVLALVPGTSRSGSTIIGATLIGTSRFIAAEFSFFLAIPTMFGASALKLLKAGFAFTGFEWFIMLIGSLTAFVVSIVVIKFLMAYIKKHDFKAFGIYRIILGIIVFAYFTLLA
ncbi:undecaprenyl-diphosphate phosphatase [Peptostreptococcus equinus]|uniref:Undecaprenyl-diphosphatase n=1 Tax=Peptostreptococcus equinus TaxID=3003601 RepID=A0ABY7JQM6_9FIRM|nr:undecaprenyl-diphosphate phosphatase [Peptostreptococcus sp. CBA3647]WAW15656.1 undecaprenyl-diphosphate phosphatase [Peptostreptococcus sp. CBA3647]